MVRKGQANGWEDIRISEAAARVPLLLPFIFARFDNSRVEINGFFKSHSSRSMMSPAPAVQKNIPAKLDC